MRRFVTVSFVVLGLCVGAGSPASAGTLSAQGNVTALDDVNQIQIVVGTADFGNELLALIELNQYAADGNTALGLLGLVLLAGLRRRTPQA